MAKNPEQKLNKLKSSYQDLSSLDGLENPITKAYQRNIFNELLSLDDLNNVNEEDLIKSTITKAILNHLALAYAEVEYEELKKDKLFEEFKSHLNDIDNNYNKSNDPETYFKDQFLENTIELDGSEIVIWQHPNFTSGNQTNQGEAYEYEQLYTNEELTKQETISFLKILKSHPKTKEHINSTLKKDEQHQEITNEIFNGFFGIKKVYDSFKSPKQIKKLKNYEAFMDLVEFIYSETEDDQNKQLIDKFYAIHHESLNSKFAQEVLEKISEYPSLKLNINAFITDVRDIKSLDDKVIARLLSSKTNLREGSDLDDEKFQEIYDDFKNSIKLVYEKDKSLEISYLYEQFVAHENVKIQGVTFITHETQGLVQDLLTVKDEAKDFGISTGELKQLKQEAEDYPNRLNENFRNKLFRDKDEMKKLRDSRLKVAKLRAYNAALDLEITNEELASGAADTKIKETVFEKAISSDLDDLFLNYQKGSRNKLRKKFNKATSWFDTKIAGLSAAAGIFIPIGLKVATKTTATLAAGPLAAVGVGALFMKPASRRLLNWDKARQHVSSDEKAYDKVALNFTEATRDMTGNYNDSIYNKTEDIENKFILAQQDQLKEFSKTISAKADRVISEDTNIKTLKNTLNRNIIENSDPISINKIANELKKAITKKITELYIQEYKKILSSIEEKRKNYALRLATEYATSFALTLGISTVCSYALEKFDLIENAEASEKSAGEPSNPKGGNSPTASKSDLDTGNVDKSDALKSKSDTTSSSQSSSKTFEILKEKATGIKKTSGSFLESLFGVSTPEEFSFKVPTNSELIGTTDKDPGLVQLIRSWTDNKLSIKQALEAAKMIEIENINMIRDGEELKLSKEALQYISDKSNISTNKLTSRSMLEQYIKYNKA